MNKPYAESCEQNREPILTVLRQHYTQPGQILEIGSGTGQHAVFFARQLPHLQWLTSDRRDYHPGIHAWLAEAKLENLAPPLDLDVTREPWPVEAIDGVFSANTAHIMSWPAVQSLFRGVGAILRPGGRFVLYGPFNYAGDYTSESNARFDQWLKQRDPASGLRQFEDLQTLATAAGLVLIQDHEMPVNNRTLVWEKRA